MHTTSISDQTDRTGPLARYDGANEYLSDSSSYSDSESDCELDIIITTSLIISPIMKKLLALQLALLGLH